MSLYEDSSMEPLIIVKYIGYILVEYVIILHCLTRKLKILPCWPTLIIVWQTTLLLLKCEYIAILVYFDACVSQTTFFIVKIWIQLQQYYLYFHFLHAYTAGPAHALIQISCTLHCSLFSKWPFSLSFFLEKYSFSQKNTVFIYISICLYIIITIMLWVLSIYAFNIVFY